MWARASVCHHHIVSLCMCLTTCSLTQSGLSSHRGNIETHDINQMLNDGNPCNGDTRGWIHIDHHEFHMHSHSSNAGGITAYHSSKADSPTAYQRAPESETGSMSELMCKEDSYTPGRTMLKVGDRIMCPQLYSQQTQHAELMHNQYQSSHNCSKLKHRNHCQAPISHIFKMRSSQQNPTWEITQIP